MLKSIMSLVVTAILIFLVIAGISYSRKSPKINENVVLCAVSGGIPIFSIWSNTVLTNCVFPNKGI
jgi:hypothetical protein